MARLNIGGQGGKAWSIKCDVETKTAIQMMMKYQKETFQKATAAALNAAARGARDMARSRARGKTTVLLKEARRRFRFQQRDKAKPGTKSQLSATLFAVTSDVKATAFGKPVQQKEGVKAGSKFFPKSFVQRVRNFTWGNFQGDFKVGDTTNLRVFKRKLSATYQESQATHKKGQFPLETQALNIGREFESEAVTAAEKAMDKIFSETFLAEFYKANI